MRRVLLLVLLCTLSACQTSTPPTASSRLLGDTTVTFSPDPDTPISAQATNTNGISVAPGTRGVIDKDGVRYLYTTLELTNHTGATLNNLTLYAQNTPQGLAGTAVSDLKNARNETPIGAAALARTIRPGHRLESHSGTLRVVQAEADFQAFDAAQVAAVQALASDATILGYGFSARGDGTRAIAPGGKGVVTLAVAFPFTAEQAADLPFRFALSFKLVDETGNRVTRSPAEHSASTRDDVCTRAASMDASNTLVVTLGGPTPRCAHTSLGDVRIAAATDDLSDLYLVSGADQPADATPGEARLELENRDGVYDGTLQAGFFNDWLAMDRIAGGKSNTGDRNWSIIKNHEVATLRLKNSGSGVLEVQGFIIQNLAASSGKWLACASASCFKLKNNEMSLTLAPGEHHDLAVAFVESAGNKGLRRSTLTILSNDPDSPEVTVQLAGGFMTRPEGNNEISHQQIADLMGYSIAIGAPLLHNDATLKGDEVRSATWRRADETKPIYARQIAAYHGCCETQDYFNLEQVNTAGKSVNLGGFSHDKAYGQSFLPLIGNHGGDPTAFAHSHITPPAGARFEIRAANYSTNPGAPGMSNSGNLGVRTWPVKDRGGTAIPNAYFVAQDFVQNGCGSGSANCDYNDNVYLIANIVPVSAD